MTVKRSIRVEKATPHLDWEPKPLPFMYIGKSLTSKTCNAITTSQHPETKEIITGRFVYCPPRRGGAAPRKTHAYGHLPAT